MSAYDPVPTNDASSPPSPTASTRTRSRRSSLHSLRSFRLTPRRNHAIPDPHEMDEAFDGPDGDEAETDGLLDRRQTVPGDYDFERDYTQPPSSPPPFQPYSAQHPAPGNTNGLIPTANPARPTPQRHFLGGLLPTSILPRQPSPRVVGGGNSGVFGNLAARPDNAPHLDDGLDYVPEETQKDAPPTYQAALRDAVPPYWDTTVVLPSSSSPFGPLSSSISGDEILIDGMPSGNFFGFFWNMIVSFSFQFVGFLLTYVLHTTHAAKFGSRVGLGMTLIQFGFSLRSKAKALISSGRFPTDPSDPDPPTTVDPDNEAAENAIEAIWGPGGSPWPVEIRPPDADPDSPYDVLHSTQEAEAWASAHNTTLSMILHLPTAEDVGRANEYFSFLMMSIGWFIVLTSLGGYWRVKRFERGLRQAQRESERAQAAAANGGEDPEPTTTTPTQSNGPTTLAYYTSAIAGVVSGANELRRGFLGMHGRPFSGRGRGQGHTPLSQHDDGDEHELLDAQGFGLGPGPMADEAPGAASRRERGLWG